MIYGIGIDLLKISRIAEAYWRHGDRFIKRILSPQEQVEWQTVASHHQSRWLGKRWAAKEALAKATGLGMRMPVAWQSMSLTHTATGQPTWHFHEALAEWMDARQLTAHLTLSDEQDFLIAQVILETRPSHINHE
jgi:holo-[acyl-carrier protein] synthase